MAMACGRTYGSADGWMGERARTDDGRAQNRPGRKTICGLAFLRSVRPVFRVRPLWRHLRRLHFVATAE